MLGALSAEAARGFFPVLVGASQSDSLSTLAGEAAGGRIVAKSRLSSGNGLISLVLTGFFCGKLPPCLGSGVVSGRRSLEEGYGIVSKPDCFDTGPGAGETALRFCVLLGMGIAIGAATNAAAAGGVREAACCNCTCSPAATKRSPPGVANAAFALD